MRSHVNLFYGFLDRHLTIFRRYPINLFGSTVGFLIMFFMIFYGGKSIAPSALGDTLGALIVGFFLWSMSQTTFLFLSNMINNEAQWGTLEQLYVSPFRFSTVMFAAVTTSVSVSVGLAVLNLAVVLVVTGETLVIDLVTTVPILVLTLCTAVGLSFTFGGVALIYKRIRGLLSIMQYVFVGLISFALTDALWPRLLPIGQGTAMLHRAMTEGVRLWEFSLVEYLLLVGTAIGYLGLGYLVFSYAQYRTRKNGMLDDY